MLTSQMLEVAVDKCMTASAKTCSNRTSSPNSQAPTFSTFYPTEARILTTKSWVLTSRKRRRRVWRWWLLWASGHPCPLISSLKELSPGRGSRRSAAVCCQMRSIWTSTHKRHSWSSLWQIQMMQKKTNKRLRRENRKKWLIKFSLGKTTNKCPPELRKHRPHRNVINKRIRVP